MKYKKNVMPAAAVPSSVRANEILRTLFSTHTIDRTHTHPTQHSSSNSSSKGGTNSSCCLLCGVQRRIPRERGAPRGTRRERARGARKATPAAETGARPLWGIKQVGAVLGEELAVCRNCALGDPTHTHTLSLSHTHTHTHTKWDGIR